MARSLDEIADELLAAEQTLKNGIDSMVKAAVAAAGASLPPDTPHAATIPFVIKLPDGRDVVLADIAAELRGRAS